MVVVVLLILTPELTGLNAELDVALARHSLLAPDYHHRQELKTQRRMAEHIDHAAMAAAHMMLNGGMNHGGMDHGGTGHGGHGGMDHDMPMPMPMPMHCKMDMTMTFDWPLQRCVVFTGWHLRSSADVYLALVVLVALSAAFEYLRWRIRAIDTFLALDLARASLHRHHARKASLAPGAGAGGNSSAGVTSGLLPSSSTADRRTNAVASSSSHTALNMSAHDDDPYRDDAAARDNGAVEEAAGGLDDDDARSKAGRQSRLLGVSSSGPSSIVNAFFCSPKTLRVSPRVQLIRVGLYGLNVAAGAFLMLVLMTYNIWRAMLGHFFFSRELGLVPPSSSRQDSGQATLVTIAGIDVDKGLSCH
ncbi:copper transpport protein [Tilletia horrida]|nr:copper transpport protein [Tilletia horrida]